MISWFSNLKDFKHQADLLKTLSAEAQLLTQKQGYLTGFCVFCNQITTMRVVPSGSAWTSLREAIMCDCGFNGRSRMVFNALLETEPRARFLLMERVTPFFKAVQHRFNFAEGCEFFSFDTPPGKTQMIGDIEVRHENLLNLSFDDDSFEYMFHGDVLEHIPDISTAFKACFRTLKPGGTMLFTCPIVDRSRNLRRCEVQGGELIHHHPPIYHGNPMSDGGSLVFTEPSWQILEDLKIAGFTEIKIGLLLDPFQGILRDANPYEEHNSGRLCSRRANEISSLANRKRLRIQT